MKIVVHGPPFLPELQKSIHEFEKHFQMILPNDYRAFLTTTGGGIAACETRYVDAKVHRNVKDSVLVGSFLTLAGIKKALRDYSGRIPESMLPVAGNVFGDLILLGVIRKTAGVYFWDHEEEALGYEMIGNIPPPDRVEYFKIASSFTAFSEMLGPYPLPE